MLCKTKSHKSGALSQGPQLILTLCLIVGSLSFISPSYAQDELPQEYQIKAVYLFNFALFLSWPDSAFQRTGQSFQICVLGQDPFGIDLDLVIENERVEGRNVIVQRLSSIQQSAACQMLFVSQSEQPRLATIFAYLKQRPILSISDMPAFVKQGGMIQFFNTSYNEVRFMVAPEAINETDLVASANLLEIAQIYRR
jgi:hypothetical protein